MVVLLTSALVAFGLSTYKKFRKTTLSADEFYHGRAISHAVLRRSVLQLKDMSVTKIQDNFNHYLRYSELFLEFLTVHHQQEDLHTFKEASKRSDKTCDIIKTFSDDHEKLSALTNELKDLISINLKKSKRTSLNKVKPNHLKKNDDEEEDDTNNDFLPVVHKIKHAFDQLSSLLIPHMEREDEFFDVKFFRKHWTEEDLRALHSKEHDLIPQFMDQKQALIFMLYHLTDEEKTFFDERLPWIMKSWLFPRWAQVEGSDVWSFATHARFDVDHKLSYWGEVRSQDFEGFWKKVYSSNL